MVRKYQRVIIEQYNRGLNRTFSYKVHAGDRQSNTMKSVFSGLKDDIYTVIAIEKSDKCDVKSYTYPFAADAGEWVREQKFSDSMEPLW